MADRDTQFQGFARALYEELSQNVLNNVLNTELKHLSDIEAFKQEQYLIIARRAYDLTWHVIGSLSSYAYDVNRGSELITFVSDLAELPEVMNSE